jgi:predicted phage terminase large subunit-like protein
MDIKDFEEKLTDLPPEKRKLFAELLQVKKNRKRTHNAKKNFLDFVKYMWPHFVQGTHHRIIAEKFDNIAKGKLKRLIVNMPPRHTKSEFASYLLPAFIMGQNPMTKIIQTSHTAELSQRFGRKTKQLIDSSEYKQVFPSTTLQADSKAAGRWDTSAGGEYFAAGVGGAITGRGADLLIIDDPHSEQDALSESAMEGAYEWYTSGPRQRLQPGGAIVLVMTRWSTIDLTGQLMKAQVEPKADQWEVVEFPAIMDSGAPTWPEYWKVEELESVKASLAVSKWNAQWMQKPTSEEGAILKREWWQPWEEKDIPDLQYIIQSYDTAFSKKETADYSAITTWGVFSPDDVKPALILLDARRGRWEFPELKEIALKEYNYWEPEMVLVEAKASGLPLSDELRRSGIPITNYTPTRGNDKRTRVNAIAPMFESGMVYYPEGRTFAEEVIEECAAFPYGENDDYVDTVTQALMRFRQSGLIQLRMDYEEEPVNNTKRIFY